MDILKVKTFLAPNMFPVYAFITRYLEEKLGVPAELSVGRSFGEFASQEADLGFLCSLPYVSLARQDPPPVEPLAAPVLQGERFQGKPVYFSDVIVRAGAAYQTLADLRGCRWSYNDPDSQSGYGITRYWLASQGETHGFFGQVIEAGFHQKSIAMVANGEVDASAIDCQVLAVELRQRPELVQRLRVIGSLGPSTIQPLVVRTGLPAGLKADLQAALLELGRDPEARATLDFGFIEKFVAVDDRSYDDVRRMLELVEGAGFLELK